MPVAQLDVTLRAVSADGTTPVTSTTPGSVIRFDLALTNLGLVPYVDILVTTDAADGSRRHRRQRRPDGQLGPDLIIDGAQIRWTGDIPVGGSVLVSGTVTVRAADDLGDRMITGIATSAAPGSNCPLGTTASHCVAAIPVLLPQLTLAKSAERAVRGRGRHGRLHRHRHQHR